MKILLITYKYPYNPPIEQFLNSEVYKLGELCSKLIFLPCAHKYEKDKMYRTPSNADVIQYQRKSRLTESFICLTGMMSHRKDIFKELKIIKNTEIVSLNIKRKEMIRQYLAAILYYHTIKSRIKGLALSKNESILLYSYWFGPAAVASEWCKEYLINHGFNAKVICRAHGDGDLYQFSEKTKYRPCYNTLSNINRIFVISEHGRMYLQDQGFDNICVNRLGVEGPNIIQNISKKRTNFVIVSCSVINENKRVFDIAKCISNIKEKNISWIHFGGGELEEHLNNWCKSNMPQNVRWNVNGWTPNTEILSFYDKNKPDLFINLSKVEGIPVSIMEALAYGIPCIATDTGATNEIILDKINGFVVPNEYNIGDVSVLINSFIEMRDDDKKQMAAEARQTWEKYYNQTSNVSDLVSKIKVIMNSPID